MLTDTPRVTLTLRTRLTLFYTAVFGVLLIGDRAVSYRVLADQLDADATASLTELTNGLHGYLQFRRATADVRLRRRPIRDEAAFVAGGDALLPDL